MDSWHELLQRIQSVAKNAEESLSTNTGVREAEQRVCSLREELARNKDALCSRPVEGPAAYVSLQKRLHICEGRLNVTKIVAGPEESYTKKRGEVDERYGRSNTKLQEYIKIVSHSIHSVEKQKSLLQRSRRKLEDGLQYMGLSDRTIDQIVNRYQADYRIFQGLSALFLVLFIYVFFIRS